MSAPAVQSRVEGPAFLKVVTTHVFLLAGSAGKKGQSKLASEKQLFAILAILAATLGKSRKPGTAPPRYAPLTMAFLAKKMGCTVRFATDLLADLVARGLIECFDSKEAKRRDLDGKCHPQAKWWGALPENWADCPPYVAPEPKLVVLPEPAAEEEDVEAAAEEEDVEAAAEEEDEPAAERQITLPPGKRSRPVAWDSTATKYAFETRTTRPVCIREFKQWNTRRFVISEADQEITENQKLKPLKSTSGVNGSEPLKSSSGVATPKPLNSTSGVGTSWKAGKQQIFEALSHYGSPDDAAVSRMIRDCRQIVPDATFDEIAHFVHQKGPRARRKENPIGFLLTAVPPCFEGDSFRAVRKALSSARTAAVVPAPEDWTPSAEDIRNAREILKRSDEYGASDVVDWAQDVMRRVS